MKTLILFGMALVPGLVFASTECKVTEYPEHYEVVCIGNEKMVPPADSNSRATDASTPVTPSESSDVKPLTGKEETSHTSMRSIPMATYQFPQRSSTSAPQTMTIPKNSLTDNSGQKTPETVVHRQGRQQYIKALQDAIAARLNVISP